MAQIKTNLQYGTTGTVQTANIHADAINDTKIADDIIGTEHFTAGEVDQTAIANQAINEAKIQISNAPTNGHFLSAQSGNTGGLTWAAAGFSPYGASAYPNGTQAISTGTWTKVTLASEYTDTNGEFASSRYTVVTAGDYIVSAQIYENGETGTNVVWHTAIYKNGSLFLRGAQTTDYGVNYTFPIAAVVIPLSADDYIELYVNHNKGSNATINYDNYGTFLNVWRLR